MNGERPNTPAPLSTDPSVEQMFREATIHRYAHGGGRVFWEGADGRRQLLLDLYGEEDGAIREYVLRLIAAAPDLLAALKELLASQLAIMPPFEAGKDAQDAWADRRAKARNDAMAAIAKATGEHS